MNASYRTIAGNLRAPSLRAERHDGDVRITDQDLQTAATVVNLRRTGMVRDAGTINGNIAFLDAAGQAIVIYGAGNTTLVQRPARGKRVRGLSCQIQSCRLFGNDDCQIIPNCLVSMLAASWRKTASSKQVRCR